VFLGHLGYYQSITRPTAVPEHDRARPMQPLINVNPTSEHELFLKLFVTNGGGW
jgi:hypothetical protein